jgi:hypothetical protein
MQVVDLTAGTQALTEFEGRDHGSEVSFIMVSTDGGSSPRTREWQCRLEPALPLTSPSYQLTLKTQV